MTFRVMGLSAECKSSQVTWVDLIFDLLQAAKEKEWNRKGEKKKERKKERERKGKEKERLPRIK